MQRRGFSVGLLVLGIALGVGLRSLFIAPEPDDSRFGNRLSDEQRLAEIEGKLRRLEVRAAPPADVALRAQQPASAPSALDASSPSPLEQVVAQAQLPRETPAESKARVAAWWQNQLSAHATEPKDALWAQSQERELSDGLADLKLSGAVLRTSCQTTLCRSDIRFDDFQHAVAEYERILHAPTSPGCSRRIVLPDPARADEPYEASAIFECKRGTAGDAVKGMQ